MLFNEMQPMKAHSPIVLTVSGIITDCSDSHQEKAASPICVTVSGIVTHVIRSAHENALSAMDVTGQPSYSWEWK